MTEETPIMVLLKEACKYIRIEVLVLPKLIPFHVAAKLPQFIRK